jgi:hypothetical protein
MQNEWGFHGVRTTFRIPFRIEGESVRGARVIVPPTTLPDGDRMAILLDPSNISFSIMSSDARSS